MSSPPSIEGMKVPEEMVDITDLIKDCASTMTYSEPVLCNQSSFSLQDAMAATQIMDRKMDCCEVPAPQVSPWRTDTDTRLCPRPPPASLDDPFAPLPWDTLTIQDVAWISLEILVRQQSLLSGASLGESTFTCLYAHTAVLADMRSRLFPGKEETLIERFEGLSMKDSPGTPAQYVLFTVALALVEITEVTRGIILNGDIYEEEDFVTNTHGITLFTEGEKVNSATLLESAMKTTSELEGQDTDEIKIILLILGFQFGYLSCCAKLARLTTTDLANTVENMQGISVMSVEKLDYLKQIVEKRLVDGYSDETKSLLHQTFDSFVNRPLVGNAPVRKVSFLPPQESIDILMTITSEIGSSLCNMLSQASTLGRIERMLDNASLSKVNILSRSLIILNLYFESKLLGKYLLQKLMVDNMRQWGHIPEAVIASEHAHSFLNRLAKPVYDTLKLRLLNRNRQRAYIEAVMLQDWMSLQNEAHLLDVHYRRENGLDNTTPPHFSQYVLIILIRLMDRFVVLGIELGLCQGHVDISFSFWYRDFLLKALWNTLSLSRRSKQEALAAAASARPAETSTKKGKGKKKSQKPKAGGGIVTKQTAEDKEDDLEMLVLDLKHNLCVGILRFIAALRQTGILKTQEFKFTSHECIFQKRFELFQPIQQPPPLSYADYLEGSDFSNVSQADLLKSTSDLFQSCKATAEQLLRDLPAINPLYSLIQQDEIRGLVKVCVGNSVYLLKLHQLVSVAATTPTTTTTTNDGNEKNGKSKIQSTKVDFDFEAHAHFCIVKLT